MMSRSGWRSPVAAGRRTLGVDPGMADGAQAVRVGLEGGGAVSGLFDGAAGARACYVFAHGAGAGMGHGFMAAAAEGLGAHGVATLRYQFPYMERGSRRPDSPGVAHRAVRGAVREAGRLLRERGEGDLPLVAGGKSFGGRMTSQAQAAEALPGVRGLVFLGFPLHAAGKPGVERAEHLFDVDVPMLFVQGTRDDLAKLELLEPVVARLGERATLKVIDGADHSFHVLRKSGRTDEEAREEMLDAVAAWVTGVIG